jgi:hypothetical protein
MKITAILFACALALTASLLAADPVAPGTKLKAPSNATMTVIQVLPGDGVLASVDAKDVHGGIYWTSGQIFIACDPKGAIDGQVVKPAPAIYATADSYSYETVGAGTKTVQKYTFTR